MFHRFTVIPLVMIVRGGTLYSFSPKHVVQSVFYLKALFFFFFLPPYCRMWDLNIKKVYVLNKYRGRIRTQTKFRNLCLQTSRQDICEFVMSQLYSLWHAPKRPVDCKIQKCGNNNQRKNYCNMWPFNLWNQICTLLSLSPLTSVVQRESDGLKFWLMDFFWRA